MRHKEFHYRWEYEFQSSPEELWTLVADTNRFNHDAGLPAVTFRSDGDDAEPPRNARRRLRLRWHGIETAWEEEPFEWLRPHRFSVVRRYAGGPIAEVRVRADLTPRDGGGTHLTYQVSARPRNIVGSILIPLQIGRRAAKKFSALLRRYDRLAGRAGEESSAEMTGGRGVTIKRDGLPAVERALSEQGASAELYERLLKTVEAGDDLAVARLRPYVLADRWRAPRREVLTLCLLATRAGLLDLRWDVLCPLCRGAEQSSARLADVRADAHCDACNIDYTANFDRSVEVTFRPNPSVRAVDVRQYCVGGPQVTPHIVAQQLLAPGATRTLAPALEEGRYRLRTMSLPGGRALVVAPDGDHEVTLPAYASGWPGDESRLAARSTIRLENRTDAEQLFILERTAWSDQAATAADVTALQVFRDLFASEALRPGEQISVGSLTVLFTDLRSSTSLYREIGDAVAFGAVMNHFDVLRREIAAEGGALIKTIGDAVMAVFRHPADALRAALRAQKILAAPPEGARPLFLKAGIHTGACIAVTLNGRLDYFGSNVNIAARLEPLSTGADCVITGDVRRDPEVATLLEDAAGGLAAEPSEARLKGFDDERFELWRVKKEVRG